MSENFDNKLDEFKSKIDSLFDNESQKSDKTDKFDITIKDIEYVVSDQFRVIEARLKTFADIIKAVSENSDNQKLIVDMARISSDLNTVYAKITSQDSDLQNIAELLKNIDSKQDGDNIIKIMNELGNFYRGFDSITTTINKNFSEFLDEFKKTSNAEEYKKLAIDIDGINNNTNSIISALSIIDHKYQDLQNLILKLSENENKFTESIEWLTSISSLLKESNQRISLLPKTTVTDEMSKNIESINSKLEVGFNAVANLDKETKDQLSVKFADINTKIADLLENTNHTHFDEKFLQLNNYIANSLSDFSSLIVQNLDQTDNFDAIENKIKISFDEFSSLIDNKFLEFQKLDELKSSVSANLVEMANFISSKFDEVKKFNELEDNLNLSFQKLTSDIDVKMSELSKLDTAIENIDSSYAKISYSIDNKFAEIKKYDDIEAKITTLFNNLNDIVENKFTQIDKFKPLSDAISSNLVLLREELFSNLSDKNSIVDLSSKLSNMLNAISSEIVHKIDSMTSLEEVRSQIVLILSQFTTEFEQQIIKTDYVDSVKEEIIACINKFSETINSKVLSFDDKFDNKMSELYRTFENTTSALNNNIGASALDVTSKIDNFYSELNQNIDTKTQDTVISISKTLDDTSNLLVDKLKAVSSETLNQINALKNQISSMSEQTLTGDELHGEILGITSELSSISNSLEFLSKFDNEKQIEEAYNKISSNINDIKSIFENFDNVCDNITNSVTSLINDKLTLFDKLKDELLTNVNSLLTSVEAFNADSGSKFNEIKSLFVNAVSDIDSNSAQRLDEIKSGIAKLIFEVNDNSESIEKNISDNFANILDLLQQNNTDKILDILGDIKRIPESLGNTIINTSASVSDKINILSDKLHETSSAETEANKNISANLDNIINKIDGNTELIVKSLHSSNSDNSIDLETVSQKFDENYTMFAKKADINCEKIISGSEQDRDIVIQKLDQIKSEILNHISSNANKNEIIDEINSVFKANIESIDNYDELSALLFSVKEEISKLSKSVKTDLDSIGNENITSNNSFSHLSSEVSKINDKSEELDSKLQQLAILLDQMKSELAESLNKSISDNDFSSKNGALSELALKFDLIKADYEYLIKTNSENGNVFSQKIDDIYDYIAQLKSILDVLIENSAGSKLEHDIDELKTDILKKFESEIKNLSISSMSSDIEKIILDIKNFKEEYSSNSEISKISEKNYLDKIQIIENKIENIAKGIKNEFALAKEDAITAEAMQSFVSGLEFLQSNFIDEVKSEIKVNQNVFETIKSDMLEKLNPQLIKNIIVDSLEKKLNEYKAQDPVSSYSFEDIESDFAKIKLLLDKEQKNQFPARLEEIRNIGLENMKFNKKFDTQIASINDWIDNTSKIIQALTDKVDKAEKLNLQEIKARLVQSESKTDNSDAIEAIDDFRTDLNKKYQIQEIKIENIDEKVASLVQKQSEPINFSSILEAIDKNAKQTSSLLNRVEGIENQMLSIQNNIEKLINYIEE